MTEQRRRLEPLRLDAPKPVQGFAKRDGGQPRERPPVGSEHVGQLPVAQHQPPARKSAALTVVAVVLSLALLVSAVVIVLFARGEVIGTSSPPPKGASISATASASPPPNDGTDAMRPALPGVDHGFIDERGGWGWCDRCWINLKDGKWGWAKAECDEGLKMNPASPQPRASLLYNEGLIALHLGNTDEARKNLTESLALRENPEVRSVLNSLGSGSRVAGPPKR